MSKPLFPNSQRNVLHVYVRTPKEGSNAFTQLFKDFLDNYSLTKIKAQIKEKIERFGIEELERILRTANISEEFTKAILKLGDEDELTQRIMGSYVYGTATAGEIKRIGLFRQLKSEPDYVKFLSGIIILLTAATVNETRLFFWIDEMEDMNYYNTKQYKQFTQSIRDLLDTVNEKFTLFANFTLSEGEEDTIKTLFGEALWSRKSYDIRFKDFRIKDALEYTSDLITHYQIDRTSPNFPFSIDAIKLELSTLPSALLTPREINKKMSGLLLYSMSNDHTQITDKVVVEFENSLLID
jgi:hypothetical protein